MLEQEQKVVTTGKKKYQVCRKISQSSKIQLCLLTNLIKKGRFWMNQKMKLWIRFLSLFLLAAFGVSLLAVPAQAEVKKLTYRTMVLGSDVVKVQPWKRKIKFMSFV